MNEENTKKLLELYDKIKTWQKKKTFKSQEERAEYIKDKAIWDKFVNDCKKY